MTGLPACPHCGGIDSVYRNVRVSGTVMEFFDVVGYSGEMPNSDMLKYTHPKTLRCSKCHKIRRDVKIVDEQYLILAPTPDKEEE